MVFAITGTLSVPRAEFEKYIRNHGGSTVTSITSTCTHLISATTGTKKCRDAESKGIEVVDEDWVRSVVGDDIESSPSKKAKTPRPNTKCSEDEDEVEDEDANGNHRVEGVVNGLSTSSQGGIFGWLTATIETVKSWWNPPLPDYLCKEYGEFEWDGHSIPIGDFDPESNMNRTDGPDLSHLPPIQYPTDFHYQPYHEFVNELTATDDLEGNLEYAGGARYSNSNEYCHVLVIESGNGVVVVEI